MQNDSAHHVTQLLGAIAHGEVDARRRLWALVYDDLRALAQVHIAREAPGRTLQPTALVHEAYLRLMAGSDDQFACRQHFFAAAANAMRRILVDEARKRARLKRGGRGVGKGGGNSKRIDADVRGEAPSPRAPIPALRIDDWEHAVFDQDPCGLIDLDDALAHLEDQQPELAELVNLRFFAGLSIDQTAQILGIARRTVENRWRFARARLHKLLTGEKGEA